MTLSLIPVALAQLPSDLTFTELERLNLGDIIYLFAALAILGAGAFSIIYIFWGGFSFILSGGDDAKVKKAVHSIRYAILGLIVALVSMFFVPFIGNLFNVNFNFFDLPTLSNKINLLFAQFRNTTSNPNVIQPGVTTPSPTSNSDINQLVK